MPDEFDLGGRQAWPTMFFFRMWRDHPAEAPGIIKHLYDMRSRAASTIDSGVAKSAKSARGLYESHFDLFKEDHAGVRKLAAWVHETVSQAVAIANGQRFKREQIRVDVTDAWSHITNDGGYHDAHYHGDCSWCGTYYLQAGSSSPTSPSGPGNGISRFYSPLPTGGMLHDVGNAYLTSNRVDITPSDGMLLLFPSYVLHSGLPYAGDVDRIVIAFNSRSSLRADPAER